MLRYCIQKKKEIDHSIMQEEGGGGGLKYWVDKLVGIYKNNA